ncbi:DUF6680 family protein [Paraburkholderia elongata]|uniref:DUF6680 domain-containing protein n=1 Tax=Paraburkholderia elongata TaxID=2675747 RepID=A0A972P2Q2_9BURK|nr:DUF6680 family protein [Paraburkholderia elongata]NPT62297.1 hypothetical protein [Paraburkholderia elongata]
MHASDYMIACATLLGPIFAVQVQKYLDRRGERTRRQIEVYRALMASRMTLNSPQHVNALNAVPLEFHGNSKVVDAWRDLLMHLNTPHANLEAWGQERIKLFVVLLKQMGESLRYGFRDAEIQGHVYYPQWQAALMSDQELLRKGLVDLIKGEGALPMKVTQFPADPEFAKRTAEVQTLLIEWLEGKRSPSMAIQAEKAEE